MVDARLRMQPKVVHQQTCTYLFKLVWTVQPQQVMHVGLSIGGAIKDSDVVAHPFLSLGNTRAHTSREYTLKSGKICLPI